jgi:hypothetical protein
MKTFVKAGHIVISTLLCITISAICLGQLAEPKYPEETITLNGFGVGYKHKLCNSPYFCITWNSLPSPVYNQLEKEYYHARQHPNNST